MKVTQIVNRSFTINMSFYVYMPWYASSALFTDNTTSGFKIKLPKTIKHNLKDFEVALVEVIDFPSLKLPQDSPNSNNTLQRIKNSFLSSEYKAFVTCDIIKPQIFGELHLKILRVVNVHSKSRNSITFDSPFYVPLSRSEFDIIQINICDENGYQLNLESDKSEKLTLVLHFRERFK